MSTRQITTWGAIFGVVLLLSIFCIGIIATGWWLSRPPVVPTVVFVTRPPQAGIVLTPSPDTFISASPTPLHGPGPHGKIVYVCQVYKTSATDQICLMDADGSNQRRLTTDNRAKHFYPSLAPDGLSVVFSSNLSGKGNYEIYEMDLLGNPRQLTQGIGILTAPEISPDGRQIAFTRSDNANQTAIWLMNRDGSNPREVYPNGWDPTWSPDGTRILFASSVPGYGIQLASVNLDGSGFQRISNLPDLRGRNDWSNDGRWLVTYSGKPWRRELFLMSPDGANPFQVSPAGGNSQGPGFSPDGGWIVFTSYFDHYGDEHGCEIYIIKIDGSSLTRLTDNDYCDWQPRWGP
jgi:Tol biopolymer transport system component